MKVLVGSTQRRAHPAWLALGPVRSSEQRPFAFSGSRKGGADAPPDTIRNEGMFCRTPRGKSEARKATYVPTPVRQCKSPAGQALSLLSLLQAELKLVEAEARTSCILLRETEMLRVRAWAGSRAHRMFPMQAEGRTRRRGSIRLFCATQEALQSSEAKAASAQVTLQAATLSAECGAAALIGTDRVACAKAAVSELAQKAGLLELSARSASDNESRRVRSTAKRHAQLLRWPPCFVCNACMRVDVRCGGARGRAARGGEWHASEATGRGTGRGERGLMLNLALALLGPLP